MRFIGSAFVAASFVLGGVVVAVGDDLPQVVQYRLDNGLEVLLAPDDKVPKVGLALVYRVGGMNEPAGRSGFAHLFEHLMFSGTAMYPRIDDTWSALGIQNNAFTEEDRTIYLEDALASALPVLLSVEADRMANLGREVDQRDVVKNEMRQSVLDSAGQPGMEALRAALFPAPHPYAESVMGSMADLDAAKLEDVKAFFDAYYVPNNAVLSLAGDLDVEAVKAMIADTFGRVPRGADVAVPVVAVPEPVALRLDVTDRLPAPVAVLAAAGPPAGSTASVALTVASDLLGNYEYGVLRRELVNTGLAINAIASWDPNSLAYYAMEELAFPIPAGRAALEPTPAGVDALTIEQAKATHLKLFTPKTMTIYSVGSVGLDAVEVELERVFGGWRNDSPGVVPVPHPSAVFAEGLKVYVTPSVGDSQAILYVARPAPAFNDPGMIEAIAVARLLGGDFTSRLNQVLRETHGYSYGVGASVWSNIPTGGMLMVSSAVQADKVGPALADIIAGFGSLATTPVAEAELARTVMATASATAGSVETSSGLFGLVMSAAGMGLTAEELNGKLDEIVALKLPAVQASAASLASLDRAVVVIAGDPDSILPQLAAIGITDITVVPPTE